MEHKRIILKLSGEVFSKENNVSVSSYFKIAKIISKIKKENKIDLCIIVGGGNIFRGRQVNEKEFDKVVADNMGMLATIINSLGLAEALNKIGCKAEILSNIEMDSVIETFTKTRAENYLKENNVVIIAGGTGNPFFSTDSAAALTACELEADLVLKATNVNGVYNKDPDKYKDAKMYKRLSYNEAIEKGLKVMDKTAFALCLEKKIPIIVFNVERLDKALKALKGQALGTMVS